MKTMRNIIIPFLALFFGMATTVQAQDNTERPSPARTITAQTPAGEIIIDYSSPGENRWETHPRRKI